MENDWERIQNEAFLLVYHGSNISLVDAFHHMPAEQRKWWLERINKERKDEAKSFSKTSNAPGLPANLRGS